MKITPHIKTLADAARPRKGEFTVKHLATGFLSTGLTAKEAAEMMQLDLNEFTWAIEEYGVVETDTHKCECPAPEWF